MATTCARAAEINTYSGGAPEAALRALAPQFEKASSHKVNFTFAIVTALQKKLLDGEKADLIFLPVPLIAEIEKRIPMRREGRLVLARVGLGVVVREGASRPDISSAGAVRTMLLGAKSIAMSEANTPGGSHVLRMLATLGIAEEVKSRLIFKAAINGGGDLVANGEADVGFYLVSEMQGVKGVTIAGLLPPGLQFFIAYGASIPISNVEPDPALAFIAFLAEPRQADQWKQAGFEPGGPAQK
jgi:molybdate transport system substrate-binding protein